MFGRKPVQPPQDDDPYDSHAYDGRASASARPRDVARVRDEHAGPHQWRDAGAYDRDPDAADAPGHWEQPDERRFYAEPDEGPRDHLPAAGPYQDARPYQDTDAYRDRDAYQDAGSYQDTGAYQDPESYWQEEDHLPPAPPAARRSGREAPRQNGAGHGGGRDHWRHARDEPRWQETASQPRYLAVRGVEKSFGNRKVVKGVSLYLRPGEAVGLLGPNGAGKTTVFYMITGLVKADRGSIELDGHDITGLPMYQHGRLGIGYLPQEASIFRGLSVEGNIRALLEQVEPNRRKREAELDALLDEFNIRHLRKTKSIALSGGERRRLEIARALATRPSYMLLDEPFAGIDPIAVGDIQALVRQLTQRGIGVLITDHNVRETLGLTDRAYIIYSGEVLTEGTTADIINDPEVRRLYLGEEFRL